MKLCLSERLLIIMLIITLVPLLIMGFFTYSIIQDAGEAMYCSNQVTLQEDDGKIDGAIQIGMADKNYITKKLLSPLSFFFGFVMLFVIITSLLFTRSITQPIKELTEAGKKVADGDLSAEIPVYDSPEEVRDLSLTINLLMGAVKYLKKENMTKSSSKSSKMSKEKRKSKKK